MNSNTVPLDEAALAIVVDLSAWVVRLAAMLDAGQRAGVTEGVDLAAAITSTTRPAICLVLDEGDDRLAVGAYRDDGTLRALGAWTLSSLRAVASAGENGQLH
jgi:hypothetical protein